MSASVRLKPCPFCGGKAIVASSGGKPPVFFAGCETLWCRGSVVTLSYSRSPKEAAKAWNRRAACEPPAPSRRDEA